VFDLPAEVYAWLYDQTHHQYINMEAVKWAMRSLWPSDSSP
jgi:hypothetical protein